MFLSTTTNNLDAKGRISVPADFRSVVDTARFDGVIVWPSINGAYLEGGDMELLDGYQRSLDNIDPMNDQREWLELSIFAASRRLSFDGGGRITLPKDLVEYAGLSDKATFVGLGRRFQIWEPESHTSRLIDVRKMAKESRSLLKPVPFPGGT